MARNAPFQPLTRREREILTLLGQNLTDREIAERLVIAQTTVKWFNRQIFNKLGVENREQAIEQAVALGILNASGAEVAPKHNLPAHLTPFVGRAEELMEVRRWLNQPHIRLITLLAPGGMGKTRLAVEAARTALDDFIDGVYFVPLVGLASSDPFISTVADALGLQFLSDGRSLAQQLVDALRRKQLLLLLDNFEHLLDSAPLVADLLMAAPNVKVLATSRERLTITGEVVYPLAGLDVAEHETKETVGPNDASQLFVLCAQRASPRFTASDARSIVRICRLVQGMPLAIELAAAWAGTLSTAEIARELEQSTDFLRTTMSNVPERLRSIRVVFEAAWARLNDDARQVFRRMSVFRGGCTREAAQVVTGASLADLALLVDKALLWRNTHTERYEVHELLRQYAQQELDAAGETDRIRQAHQRYYARFAQTWGAAMQEDKQVEGLARLDADENNIREAFAYATLHATPEAIEPFTDMWLYYDLRCRWEEGDRLFITAGNALEPQDSIALAKLLTGRAIFYERLSLWEPELEVGKRSYEMTLRLGVRRPLPLAMIVYADALRDLGRHDEALPIYQHGLVLAAEINSPLMVAMFTFHLANDAAIRGRWDEAKVRMTEAYGGLSKLNNLWAACIALKNLGWFAYWTDNLDEAQRRFQEAIQLSGPIHHDHVIHDAIIGLNAIARVRNDWHTVYRLSLETLRARADTAVRYQIFMALANLTEAALRFNDLDDVRRWIGEVLQMLREWQVEADVAQRMSLEACIQLLFAAGGLFVHTGDYSRAVVFLSSVEASIKRSDLDFRATEPFKELLPEFLDECRTALTPDVFTAAVERGKTLTFETALTELAAIC